MSPRIAFVDRPCIDHGQTGGADGYTRVRIGGERLLAHRWVFRMKHGYLPPVVMHACDNPRCIEITHLQAGDWDKNNKDRAAKGRSAANVPARRRLTAAIADEIRHRFAMRSPRDPVNGPRALAREFGVDANVIYQIAGGRTYRA